MQPGQCTRPGVLVVEQRFERGHDRQRLAEGGEAEPARHAHLACFTELAEAAEPHLRRAGQLKWLVTPEAEHDNIGAAMHSALAAGASGWYWWLGRHRAEGLELITAVPLRLAGGSACHSASPVMPSGSRLVARIRSRRHSPSTRWANTAADSTTCSQLSRISSASRSRIAAARPMTPPPSRPPDSRYSACGWLQHADAAVRLNPIRSTSAAHRRHGMGGTGSRDTRPAVPWICLAGGTARKAQWP
ncbi:hypothetical protein [Streptomyces sp. SD15]